MAVTPQEGRRCCAHAEEQGGWIPGSNDSDEEYDDHPALTAGPPAAPVDAMLQIPKAVSEAVAAMVEEVAATAEAEAEGYSASR